MDIARQKQMDEAAAILIATGYVLFFCVALTLGFFLYTYYYAYPATPTSPVNPIATSLPPRTPTPHIPSVEIADAEVIFEEDFSSNDRLWTNRNIESTELEVKDGQLVLRARDEGYYAVTGCGSCPYLEEPYYLQADLETAAATDGSFGIIFSVARIDTVFYLLDFNTESKEYHIYYHTRGGWSLRVAGKSEEIKPFPETNTFGIYANGETVEIYVNGNIIDSYTETGVSFHEGYFGFMVNDANFKLIVDNVIVRKAGN